MKPSGEGAEIAETARAGAGAPHLLRPLELRALTLPARIAVAPMCQYMAREGVAGAWHAAHVSTLLCGGFGLVTMEATAVTPEGRITPNCLGLWNDEQEAALSKLVRHLREFTDAPLGIQIAHAGRKASTHAPFVMPELNGARAKPPPANAIPRGSVPPDSGGWRAVGASPIAFGSLPVPIELDESAMEALARAFVRAAERALRIGFDYLEVHAAHGYLLSSFLSPLSNRRSDRFGGSFESRLRFPLEVVERVRAAWPPDRPLGVRFGGSDWAEGGWSIDDAAAFAIELVDRGVDLLSVSTAGNAPTTPASSPGWLVPHARDVRTAIHGARPETRAAIFAVGELDDPALAERTIAEGAADGVLVARGALRDPRFPWRAARALGALPPCMPQYAWAVGR